MAVLSVQSHVAYGRVGNTAATFLLQRLGLEVWPVMTVQLSNHTGYETARGQAFPAEHIREVLRGIAERGIFPDCRAVLSGYLGEPAVGEAVLEALEAVRAVNPDALYCCDPVMGDRDRGFYVREGVSDFFRERALPAADILTPNLFELEQLSGRRIGSLEETLAAARALLALGPGIVLVTSLKPESDDDEIGLLAVTAKDSYSVTTPRLLLDPAPNGAGDCLAALFLGFLLRGCRIKHALANAAAAIFAILNETAAAESRELQLVAAQDLILRPPQSFKVRKVG